MSDECNLESLKEDYKKIQKKYYLPEFEKLNEDFQIEKLAETETDFLVREIRKFVADKFMNYLRFIESILNPVNAPMFVFSIVKSISEDEKKKLTEVYKKLAKCEVDLIGLDLEFVEENEAKFLKESYGLWQEMKKDILEVIEVIKKNWDNKIESNGKNYFG
ncbi:MAG: hypothetical protein KJ559_00825 [Nanoarchaeota archaeon]|nr:hypothetical protein [Nanoarchaeota archaeon]